MCDICSLGSFGSTAGSRGQDLSHVSGNRAACEISDLICVVAGTMQAPMMGAPTMMMSATIPGVHPDFPQFGPAQPYPTVVTPQDELLLRQLQSLGHTAGMDGLPGYPYIGAPYIGVYSAQNDAYGEAPAEEPAYNADEDEVRGTQV